MSVLTHVAIGSNDLQRSGAFYDGALGALGVKRLMEMEETLVYGIDAPAVIIRTPFDGKPASFGNGSTVGFAASDRKAVDAFHAAGLANGGSCEGPPGSRSFHPLAYGAYLRDPEGNKICAFSYTPE